MHKFLILGLILVSAAFAIEQNDVEFSRPGGVPMTLDLKVPDGNGPFLPPSSFTAVVSRTAIREPM